MTNFRKAIALSTGLTCAALGAHAQENVMVVFDGSNSMWGQIDGVAKIEIARGMMDNLLGDWADDKQVGLMAYGHRRRGDCGDIETLVEPGQGARSDILDKINGITPTGKTPLTDAVERAATELAYTDRPATVVLISDGLESCDRDPCALAAALERGGVNFTAHVVGFGLGADEDTASLACIAEETGGTYIQASNANELQQALSSVSSAVAEAPAAVVEPEPEPEPEPEAPKVTVNGPATAVGGSEINVSWDPVLGNGRYITVVPAGTKEGEYGPYVSVNDKSEASLSIPGQAGLYEIRYMSNDGQTLGDAPLEITKPEVALTAPDIAMTGATIEVAWDPTINRRDYVTIVPAGADPGTFGSYLTVTRNTEGTITAAAEPGLYEIRYVLQIDQTTVASRPIEIAAPQVVLTVPETGLTGGRIPVSWSGTVNERDYITIVPAGTDEGEYGNYIVVRDDSEGMVQAPAAAGLYEVRYVLREGGKTLATAPIEITEPEVTVTAPETAATGEKFEVSWTGAVNPNDYVTIVPVGADEGEFGNYLVVRTNTEGTLLAPADAGLYEVRYVLREGSKTVTSTPIEVTEPQVTVTAPATGLAGAKIPVSWTGAVNGNDYITIVPVGTAEGEFGNYFVVRTASDGEVQAPAQSGLYEIRYVLREGGKTMATSAIELTDAEVTVSGPDQVRAGDTIKVSWTGTVDPGDYVALVPMGSPDDDFSSYFSVRSQTERDIKAPETTGMYELRYILREGTRVLARKPIEVLTEDATLNTGATLDAPASGASGSQIQVAWTASSDGKDQRITLAKPDQAIFTWISAVKINGPDPVSITLPDAPGSYELRFLDVSNQAVLARQVIEVQ